MFWCTSYQFMMICQWNHVKMNQDPWWRALCTQSICCNYDENVIHVWSLGIVYHIKHAWRSLLEQTNMFWCVSYQFMMIYQWNHVKMNQNQDPWSVTVFNGQLVSNLICVINLLSYILRTYVVSVHHVYQCITGIIYYIKF